MSGRWRAIRSVLRKRVDLVDVSWAPVSADAPATLVIVYDAANLPCLGSDSTDYFDREPGAATCAECGAVVPLGEDGRLVEHRP